jgi:hypothetical protein
MRNLITVIALPALRQHGVGVSAVPAQATKTTTIKG